MQDSKPRAFFRSACRTHLRSKMQGWASEDLFVFGPGKLHSSGLRGRLADEAENAGPSCCKQSKAFLGAVQE